jgi:hypothetical protein
MATSRIEQNVTLIPNLFAAAGGWPTDVLTFLCFQRFDGSTLSACTSLDRPWMDPAHVSDAVT